MNYAADRVNDVAGEPSLTDMTEFAINMLSKNQKGYFLLVEGMNHTLVQSQNFLLESIKQGVLF